MTYVLAAALQEAVYGRLTADPSIAGLIGSAVFDAAPAGQVPPLYVALGPEDVRDRSDKTAHAALHVLTVTIVSEGGGFHAAKVLAAAVEEALTVMPLKHGFACAPALIATIICAFARPLNDSARARLMTCPP